ncbi:MAG: hypothetical protein ACTS3F_10250 [Phycisphaerales bacterium]
MTPHPPPAPPIAPAPSPRPHTLPHALTFFLSAAERAAVLRTLKQHHPDRRTALLAALHINHPTTPEAKP